MMSCWMLDLPEQVLGMLFQGNNIIMVKWKAQNMLLCMSRFWEKQMRYTFNFMRQVRTPRQLACVRCVDLCTREGKGTQSHHSECPLLWEDPRRDLMMSCDIVISLPQAWGSSAMISLPQTPMQFVLISSQKYRCTFSLQQKSPS